MSVFPFVTLLKWSVDSEACYGIKFNQVGPVRISLGSSVEWKMRKLSLAMNYLLLFRVFSHGVFSWPITGKKKKSI